MNKLVCIVGPTGTGKTQKAIELASLKPSILVSADSRQVYRGMDIVTGKDHPKDLVIYGIDIVEPNESCSVSVWHDSVLPHIVRAWAEGKQVIVVGGTGLYVKALTGGIETMQIPIDQTLRDTLAPLSIAELQQKLIQLNPSKFDSLNHSDSLNSRRLIRAIEVAMSTISPLKSKISNLHAQAGLESNIIGLNCKDDSNHRYRILERVKNRLEKGAVAETKSLIQKYDKSLQSMSAIGYRSIIKYLENTLTESEMIDEWVGGELAYAKRQLTWFRKQSVIWYDVDNYGTTKD